MKYFFIFIISSFVLASCSPQLQPTFQPDIIDVYSTSAAQPWMSDLFTCANDLAVGLNVTGDSPDIYLQVGELENLLSHAYQIDQEELLIVTHRESPLRNLTLSDVQDLFAGQGDLSVELWIYSSDADLEIAFDQLVMKGRAVSSFVSVASGPQEMSDILNNQSKAVGILPRHWKAGTVREVYSAGIIPVLAITKNEPNETVNQLIGCLQK